MFKFVTVIYKTKITIQQECRNRLEEAARAEREELGKAGHPPPKPAKCMVGRDECMDPNNECVSE